MKMSRRNALKTSLLAGTSLALMPVEHYANVLAPEGYLDQIGLQLWTVRDQLAQDFEGTIRTVQQAGYRQVEAMGLDQLPRLQPIAKDLGLSIKSSFMTWTVLTGRWELVGGAPSPMPTEESVIETAKQYGLEYLVFGYLRPEERQTLDQYKELIEKLNRFGQKCQQAGLKLCYHNHSFEFGKIEGQVPFELLIKGLDPQFVQFELDVFWASLGGYDPLKLMKKMQGQIRLLHLKDKLVGAPVQHDESKVPVETFKELGNGEVAIDKIVRLARKLGVEQCIVEQDQSPAPLKSIGQSMEYLRKIQA